MDQQWCAREQQIEFTIDVLFLRKSSKSADDDDDMPLASLDIACNMVNDDNNNWFFGDNNSGGGCGKSSAVQIVRCSPSAQLLG